MIQVSVPASTANLGPGFDVMALALDLRNEWRFAWSDGEDRLSARGLAARLLEDPAQNLTYQAARRLMAEAGRAGHVAIHCTSRIPVTAGLGSSAAAIAAGLVGMNALMGDPVDPARLMAMGVDMEGHPDNIVAAMVGGLTIGYTAEDGRAGGYRRIEPPAGLVAVAVWPRTPLSTRVSRDVLAPTVSRRDAVFNLQRVAMLTHAFVTGDLSSLAEITRDRLHQPQREALIPGLLDSLERALAAGARCAFLSGAGPARLALVDDDPAVVERVIGAMGGADMVHWSGRMDTEGARVLAAGDQRVTGTASTRR